MRKRLLELLVYIVRPRYRYKIFVEKIKILIFQQPLISSPMNLARTDKIDKQLQTRSKTTPKVSPDPEREKCLIVEM